MREKCSIFRSLVRDPLLEDSFGLLLRKCHKRLRDARKLFSRRVHEMPLAVVWPAFHVEDYEVSGFYVKAERVSIEERHAETGNHRLPDCFIAARPHADRRAQSLRRENLVDRETCARARLAHK